MKNKDFLRCTVNALLVTSAVLCSAITPRQAVAQPLILAPQNSATQSLRRLLSEVPASVLGEVSTTPTLSFGDIAAARIGLASAPGIGSLSAAVLRALPNGRFVQVRPGAADDWRAAVGFSVEDINQIFTLDAGPASLSLLDLTAEAAQAVPEALAGSGYAQAARDGSVVWEWGEDGAVNVEARVLHDPFRGRIGHASRVTMGGDDILRHASTWPLIEGFTREIDLSLADLAPLNAAMRALDTVVGAPLLKATIYPYTSSLGLPVPIEGGAWSSVIVADFATGADWTAVLALTSSDLVLSDAADLRHRLRANWDAAGLPMRGQTYRESTQDQVPQIWVLNRGLGVQVVMLILSGQADLEPPYTRANPGVAFFDQALLMGDVAFLQ